MSNKDIQKSAIVIDASIAQSAAGFDSNSVFPEGKHCREFLIVLRGAGHRILIGTLLKQEWDRHKSNFFSTWLTSMFNIGKTSWIDDTPSDDWIQMIDELTTDKTAVELMIKDAHLIFAASSSNSPIASRDEKARRMFALHLRAADTVMDIVWINPCSESEGPLDWLRSGAPAEPSRTLRYLPL